jgi:uncharacterized C2H2 Zn-finger protein
MVEYQCKNCSKIFFKKYNYTRHIERKTPCSILKKSFQVKKKNFKCKKCKKIFNRKDNYIRHINKCSCTSNTDLSLKKNTKQKIIGNISGQVLNGDINGDHNKFIIKNYNLFPFGKDGIDCLTIPEKIAIFSSDENPMEMIIVKVHLDPLKLNHHNVGYTDEHSGYGIIFDGDKWLTERIEVIMEVLLESKEQDLLKIHDEIKHILTDDKNKNIENTLNNLDRKLRPTNKIDTASKRNLIAHLKKHFYNKKELVLEAKKNTDSKKTSIKKEDEKFNLEGVLKEGYTLEDAILSVKENNNKIKRVQLQKEMAKSLMQQMEEISKGDYLLMSKQIDQINDPNALSIILRLLNRAYCFCEEFDSDIIKKEIEKDDMSKNII